MLNCKLIDVGGFKLHYHLTGPTNDLPTVIIEAGCGQTTPVYHWLQERLSEHVQVCTYDRAGLGLSDKSNQPQDAVHIAEQLHRLLNTASIKAPYIFVGHSLAGLIMRVYFGKYPNDIKGMVFIDSSHPEQYDVLETDRLNRQVRRLNRLVGFSAKLGFTHLVNPLFNAKNSGLSGLPESALMQLKRYSHQSSTYATAQSEMDLFSESAQQAELSGDLGDCPVTVITGPDTSSLPKGVDCEEYVSSWLDLQKDLVTLSTRGKHKVIDGAGHMSLVTDKQYSDQVADEILQMVFGHE